MLLALLTNKKKRVTREICIRLLTKALKQGKQHKIVKNKFYKCVCTYICRILIKDGQGTIFGMKATHIYARSALMCNLQIQLNQLFLVMQFMRVVMIKKPTCEAYVFNNEL